MPNENIDLKDGVTRKEAGFVVLVVAFTITLVFAFYKAIVAGDFPNNVTDFLTILAFIIGACETIPHVAGRMRGK